MDDTLKLENLELSIKKYLVDNLETSLGILISFDTINIAPVLSGHTVNRWISVEMGPIKFDTASDLLLDLHCVTRKDNMGVKL
jgi:hypothetical protein